MMATRRTDGRASATFMDSIYGTRPPVSAVDDEALIRIRDEEKGS